MTSRDRKAGKKAVPKRMVVAKRTAPARKVEPKKAAGKTVPAKGKAGPATAKKPLKPVPTAGKPQILSKGAVGVKPEPAAKVAPTSVPSAKPAPASAKVAPSSGSPQQAEERRKAATRKFFARLRSLEAIVGADLRKRGSLVLMQAVDQWYSEAVSPTATDVSITNAAKAVIGHL